VWNNIFLFFNIFKMTDKCPIRPSAAEVLREPELGLNDFEQSEVIKLPKFRELLSSLLREINKLQKSTENRIQKTAIKC